MDKEICYLASLILFSRWLRWSLLFAKVLDRQVIGIRYPGYARILHRLKPLFSIKCFCLIFLNLYTSIWIFSFRECYGRCSRGNVVGTNYMQFCYVLVFLCTTLSCVGYGWYVFMNDGDRRSVLRLFLNPLATFSASLMCVVLSGSEFKDFHFWPYYTMQDS